MATNELANIIPVAQHFGACGCRLHERSARHTEYCWKLYDYVFPWLLEQMNKIALEVSH